MPDDLAAEITQAYAELAGMQGAAVAVRSSATAEDLPTASFAGQQETFLNVQGEEALLEAVKACWASLWTARALAYRRRQGIAPASVSIAVIVQTLAPATLSGILFTANPTTGVRDELVVEASFGLGEAIVSGAVTPDSYLLDRARLAPKESRLGDKSVMIVANPQGGADTEPVPAALRGESTLTPAQLREVAALGIQVESCFGGVPQDIEWALADGQTLAAPGPAYHQLTARSLAGCALGSTPTGLYLDASAGGRTYA
jgi:rifampicin phosphotransferase